MQTVIIQIAHEPHGRGLALPSYATPGSAGMDLRAAVPEEAPVHLNPGQRYLVPTGLRIAIPIGFEGQMRPRSGLALKYGIGMVNSPGTIDSDYRGEISVLLINLGSDPFIIRRGDRIAQMVIAPIVVAEMVEVDPDDLDLTGRGGGGFGSTG